MDPENQRGIDEMDQQTTHGLPEAPPAAYPVVSGFGLADSVAYYDGSYGDPLGVPGQHGEYPLGPLEMAAFDPAVVTGYAPYMGDTYAALPLTQPIWPGTSVGTSTWIDGQTLDMHAGFTPMTTTTTTTTSDGAVYDYDIDYFQSGDGASLSYGAAMASGTSSTVWAATVPDENGSTSRSSLSSTAQSQSTSSAGPSSEKGKRKRGRPRVYDDDGTPRPKGKPGRPPIYNATPESSTSLSPELRRSPSFSRHTKPVRPPLAVARAKSGFGSDAGLSDSRAVSFAPTIEDDEEEEVSGRSPALRARNKAAAARYRAKTQNTIATMEAEEREVSMRRQALLAAAGRLRDEVFQLKNEVLRHADCGCPLISGYLSEAALKAYANLGKSSSPLMDRISDEGDVAGVMHGKECSEGHVHGTWDGYAGGVRADGSAVGEWRNGDA